MKSKHERELSRWCDPRRIFIVIFIAYFDVRLYVRSTYILYVYTISVGKYVAILWYLNRTVIVNLQLDYFERHVLVPVPHSYYIYSYSAILYDYLSDAINFSRRGNLNVFVIWYLYRWSAVSAAFFYTQIALETR